MGNNIKRWEPTRELERWEPAREVEDFMNRFARLFSAPLSLDLGEEALTTAQWMPPVDIQETPEAYLISAELPDMKKEDVKVTLEEGVLSLSGERMMEKEEKNKKVHRLERRYGRFARSFTLPGSVDEAKVSASFRDGLLHIQVPKLAQAIAVREIKIQ